MFTIKHTYGSKRPKLSLHVGFSKLQITQIGPSTLGFLCSLAQSVHITKPHYNPDLTTILSQ